MKHLAKKHQCKYLWKFMNILPVYNMIDIAFFLSPANPTRLSSPCSPPFSPQGPKILTFPSLPSKTRRLRSREPTARVLKINIIGEVSLVGPEFPCSPAPEGIEKWRSCCEVDGTFGEDGFWWDSEGFGPAWFFIATFLTDYIVYKFNNCFWSQ